MIWLNVIAWFIFLPFLILLTCVIISLDIGLEDLNSNLKLIGFFPKEKNLIGQFKGSLERAFKDEFFSNQWELNLFVNYFKDEVLERKLSYMLSMLKDFLLEINLI